METSYINSVRPFLQELAPLQVRPTGASHLLKEFKPKAVIFDIYGTLLISASGDVDAAEYNSGMMRKALEAAHYTLLSQEESSLDRIYTIYKDCLATHYDQGRAEGRPYPEVDIIAVWQDTVKAAVGEKLIALVPESDVYLLVFVFELQTNKVWPMPGMETLVRRLTQTDLHLGIVSNAQFYTPVILNHFLYDIAKGGSDVAPFDSDLCVWSYKKLRGKPDVALYEYLLPVFEQKGLKADEVLYVGNDMLKDMYAASQIGMKTAFFAGDMRAYRLHGDDERTANLKPDFVITELLQLLTILGIE